MNFVVPSTAVDPALAALFASSSDPLQDQDHQLQQSSTIAAQERPRNWKEAAPPNKRLSKLRRQQPAPVEAQPNKRPAKRRRRQPAPVEAQEDTQLQTPTDQKILELFERIQKNRPGFVFLPGDMRNTLETQLKWSVERSRIVRLWEMATQPAAHDNSAPGPSSASENDLEEIYMPGSNSMEYEDDDLIVTRKIYILTVLMKHQKHWQVSEERLDKILMEMDQADIAGVFAMPTPRTYASSSERYNTADASLASDNPFVEVPTKELATSSPASVLEKQLFRNNLFSRVLAQRPAHARRITHMLLKLDNPELSALLRDDDAMFVRIEELAHVHYTDSYPTRAESGATYLDADISAKQTPSPRIQYTWNELLGLRNPIQAEHPSLARSSDNNNVKPSETHEELPNQKPKWGLYG